MKLIITLLLASGLAAWAQTEEQIHKQFTVQPGGRLVVELDFGSIEVGTNANSEVTVDVSRKVMMESKAEEDAFLADRPVEISQQGDTVTVQSRAVPGAAKPRGRTRTQAKYTILVPSTCQAQLQTAGGGITVSGLNAKVKTSTSGGSLAFEHLRGDLDGKTAGGGIRLRDCEGTQKVNTSGGNIESDGGGGKLEGETSGGRITVLGFRGPVRVGTTGGGLTFKDVAGRLEGSTSGGSIMASFASPLSDEVKLATTGGSVTLQVAANSAFDLDAATTGGGVSSDLPVTTEAKPNRSHLKGPVNGGGKPVVLRTLGGSIKVKTTER